MSDARGKKMDSNEDKLSLAFTFVDSLFFNNTMRIVNLETSEITMRFFPMSFEISFGNDMNSAAHHIEFFPHELQEYFYNARDSDGELLPHLCLTFQVVDLFKVIDGIKRHDSIRILYYEGSMSLLIRPVDSSSSGRGKATNHIVNLKFKHLPPVNFSPFADDQPSGSWYTGYFSTLCASAVKRRVSYLALSQHGEILRCAGYHANHTMAFIQECDICPVKQGDYRPPAEADPSLDDDDSEREPSSLDDSEETVEGLSVRVPLPTIKSLGKLHAITSAGTLMRFYFGKGKPVRISCAIGTIGIYNVVLRSVDEIKKKGKRR